MSATMAIDVGLMTGVTASDTHDIQCGIKSFISSVRYLFDMMP